ncbi:phage tail protein [Pseudomonas protegens]|uniref:phage tail protein n=1 Tax=Pseudomonas protegens TaxID=380021 RepID=UPI002937010B|nr:phage tail protein [Pseudomonas protegens]WOE80816.1 phage tail protein [Pseudomonas protegens]
MDYPKSVPSVGLVNGRFVDENPVTGQVGSLISSQWGNAVTDELLNVIRAGGKAPAEAEHDQLLAAIKAIVRDSIPPEKIRATLADYGITDAYTKSVTYTKAEIEALLKNMSALPVGAMVPFPKGTVPAGFLEVDGSVQSAATYPDLAAYLGTTFNTGGEGAGNFRLPESRGEFLRGWDHGRGVDAGRTLGSGQTDALQNITGESSTFPVGVTAPVNSSGAFKTNARSLVPTGIAGGGAWSSASVEFDASRVARTATETRPRNLAVMWCIKAWNAPVNQGNIDVAALAPLAAQATEINQGTTKVATLAQLIAGTDDAVTATPKKLRFGFALSLATNGYIAFPTWLGGLVIQWGYYAGSLDDQSALVQFPMAFPSSCMNVLVTADGAQSGGGAFVGAGAQKDTPGRFRLNGYGAAMPSVGYHWLALGY